MVKLVTANANSHFATKRLVGSLLLLCDYLLYADQQSGQQQTTDIHLWFIRIVRLEGSLLIKNALSLLPSLIRPSLNTLPEHIRFIITHGVVEEDAGQWPATKRAHLIIGLRLLFAKFGQVDWEWGEAPFELRFDFKFNMIIIRNSEFYVEVEDSVECVLIWNEFLVCYNNDKFNGNVMVFTVNNYPNVTYLRWINKMI